MCGINGFNFVNKELVLKMNEATMHRGPDGTGVFFDEHISFGHNVLAISDNVENCLQPYVSPDKNYALIFNGEIYNYLDLKKDLEIRGVVFKTDSDTEVLFWGLIKEGGNFIDKLDGMFAFAFYNKQKSEILLARDASGMKPLYYYHKDNKFIFSSELRGLFVHDMTRKVDLDSASIYFSIGYVPGEKTLVQDINKICPSQYLLFDTKSKSLKKGWHSQTKSLNLNKGQSPDLLINKSVRAHTMGKRPYGLYLSGGMDSTIILYELSKFHKESINTYSTAFDTKDEKINEDAMLAKRLTGDFKINHHELFITEKDFIDATEKTIEAVEEPRYNFSIPAYWLLAKQASKDIVVVLSGSGGDETFLGYNRYLESQNISSRFDKYPNFLFNYWYGIKKYQQGYEKSDSFFNLEKTLDRFVYLNSLNRVGRSEYDNIFKFKHLNLKKYLQEINYPAFSSPSGDMENDQAGLDRLFWLADEDFIRSDKIMMSHSMEGRFPFVAKDIIDYVNNIPSREKLVGGQTKSMLRRTYQGKLPDYITSKKKSGWYAPTVEWMGSEYGEFVKEILSPGYYDKTNELFDLDFVRKEFVENVDKHSLASLKRFMPIFSFQIWAKHFDISL